MQITNYHAKYYSYVLSQSGINNIDKLALILSDSNVDLNPHQIEAALFAFRTPFLKGVILADEVGLGKTVEAGIVIAQKWAEGKRKIIIIVPANLRVQWKTEMYEKFYIPSIILDRNNYNKKCFDEEALFIMSYNFASNKSKDIQKIDWDLSVIDEAHRLRNVFRKSSVIAKNIQDCTKNSFKLLLTATPFQNSLLELYGLSTFIDEYTFGNLESFKAQYSFIYDENSDIFNELSERLKAFCIRTLRRQVVEYIKYTKRQPITQEFTPTKEEQTFYDIISSYLRRETLIALPNGQRHLISLILWKLLASSTFAITGTLNKLIKRLENMLENDIEEDISDTISDDFEGLIDDETPDKKVLKKKLSDIKRQKIENELEELKNYYNLAVSIKENAKGKALLQALKNGFSELKKLKAPQKAVIFTESRRTLEYIESILSETKYKTVVFHGGLSTKVREEVKEQFKTDANILVATEAAAEGQNFQFCSMVINYDLPYNPQRIEQRIGRCHRYGQKFDVVVINFLNKNNIAEQRVFQLLSEKFKLFEGVFGASDSILGTIEGADFEKRIIEIYQECRTEKEIQNKFDELQKQYDSQIQMQMNDARKKLLENFDEEVASRLKSNLQHEETALNKIENMLWNLTKYKLDGKYAEFDEELKFFKVTTSPYYNSKHGYKRHVGDYYFKKDVKLSERYRVKCSLAQSIIDEMKNLYLTANKEICFDMTGYYGRFSDVEPLIGKSGYLSLYSVEIIYPKHRDFELLFSGYCEDDNIVLNQKQMKRFFSLSGTETDINKNEMDYVNKEVNNKLNSLFKNELEQYLQEISLKNSNYFEEETEKLEKWSKDIKLGLERNLNDIDKQIEQTRKNSRGSMTLQKRIELQEQLRKLESKRNELRMKIYEEQDKIDKERENLIEEVKRNITQKIDKKLLFTIKWRII